MTQTPDELLASPSGQLLYDVVDGLMHVAKHGTPNEAVIAACKLRSSYRSVGDALTVAMNTLRRHLQPVADETCPRAWHAALVAAEALESEARALSTHGNDRPARDDLA